MNTTHKLNFDLTRKASILQPVHAVQGDTNTRVLEITLLENRSAWTPAAGASFCLAFRKPDGTRGLYDTLPDGTAAATVTENVVSMALAPQVLTVPGEVKAILVIQDEAMNRISTFPFSIEVAADPSAGAQASNDYYNYSTLSEINAAIGSLEDLKTNAKGSLVSAINEIFSKGVFYVTAIVESTDEYGTWCTADKTMAEIIEAYNAERSVYLRYPLMEVDGEKIYLLLPMVQCASTAIGFNLYVGTESIGSFGNAVYEALLEDDEPFYVTRKDLGSHVTDDHINSLIDAKLAEIPVAEEASF